MQCGRRHEQLSVSNNEKNLQTKQITVDHLELNVSIFAVKFLRPHGATSPQELFLLVGGYETYFLCMSV